MKKYLFLFMSLCVISTSFAQEEPPEFEWEKTYGGPEYSSVYAVAQAPDGGYVAAGQVVGVPQYDYWVFKTDVDGNLEWNKPFVRSGSNRVLSIVSTQDGGYIVNGFSQGNTEGYGQYDYWVLKLDSEGNIQWENYYGGSNNDTGRNVIQDSAGNYLISGHSGSEDWDVSGVHGGYDYWVAKLNPEGEIIWQKALGGSDNELSAYILESNTGGYIVIGGSRSSDGDVGANYGNEDIWIVKLDDSGNIEWSKNYGGSAQDHIAEWNDPIRNTKDGGYIFTALTYSNDGDVSGNHGGSDVWLVKISSTGDIEWEKTYGGTGNEVPAGVQLTLDGGYLVARKDNPKFFKVNSTGEVLWEKEFSDPDLFQFPEVLQSVNDGFLLAGSGISFIDFSYFSWIKKISEECVYPSLEVASNFSVCYGSSLSITASTDGQTVSWYDSIDGDTPFYTGLTLELENLTESVTYWVEADNYGACFSERKEVNITVTPLPLLEIENPEVEVCLGSDAYLYAFSEGNVIFWYAEEDDTEYLYHGNNFIVEGLTETTTFWVEAYNLNTGCVSERIPVTVTVTPVADISAEETEFEICSGNTATLTATSDSTVNWYDTADGTEPIFSGEEFTTPILNSTTHYWAEASGEGECVSGRIEFTVNVNASPDAPEAQPIQAYVEGMILADFEVEHTGTLHWYADEELTIELPDTTPVVIHTTYYVTQSLGDCESEATGIMADNFLNTGNPIKDEFAYYPNPVQDRLNFKGSSKVEYVQIFDMSGRLMMDQTNMNSGIEQLDVSSLPKGSYVVKAQTEKGMKTFKIVKR